MRWAFLLNQELECAENTFTSLSVANCGSKMSYNISSSNNNNSNGSWQQQRLQQQVTDLPALLCHACWKKKKKKTTHRANYVQCIFLRIDVVSMTCFQDRRICALCVVFFFFSFRCCGCSCMWMHCDYLTLWACFTSLPIELANVSWSNEKQFIGFSLPHSYTSHLRF